VGYRNFGRSFCGLAVDYYSLFCTSWSTPSWGEFRSNVKQLIKSGKDLGCRMMFMLSDDSDRWARIVASLVARRAAEQVLTLFKF
jgi:hypothetical protein